MSNSKLISYTHLTTHHSGKRKYKIDRITPHCLVGQWSAKQAADYFAQTDRKASCNYTIGKHGDIALCVDEANRSWCSSSALNDNRAVTIECASDVSHPYRMTDAVYQSLIKLCVDICKRNGKDKLLWIPDKNKALAYKPKTNEMLLTVHRWFFNKACPGEWLMSRMDDLAKSVTEELSEDYAKKVAERFGLEPQTMAYLEGYEFSRHLLPKLATTGGEPDINLYGEYVRKRFGFEKHTVEYLKKYKYGKALLMKLATK